jgi:hypothetical protein
MADRKGKSGKSAKGGPAKGAGLSPEAVRKVLRSEMPDWLLVGDDERSEADPKDNLKMKIDKTPSIADLRRKYFGGGDVDGGAADSGPKYKMAKNVQTVRIKPRRGGPAKTADIKNGKVTIVQG